MRQNSEITLSTSRPIQHPQRDKGLVIVGDNPVPDWINLCLCVRKLAINLVINNKAVTRNDALLRSAKDTYSLNEPKQQTEIEFAISGVEEEFIQGLTVR